MSTVPCFKSSNEVSYIYYIVVVRFTGGAGCAIFIPFKLVDAASSTPVHQRGGPSVVLTLRVKLFAWQIHWQTRQCSIIA